MKRILAIICVVVALFSCGCDAGAKSTFTSRMTPENGTQALKYFHQELDNAIDEEDYTALRCLSRAYEVNSTTSTACDFTLQDKAFIRSLLKTLKKTKFSSIEQINPNRTGCGPVTMWYLEYGDSTVPVCGMYPSNDPDESCIGICYTDDIAYEFYLRDPSLVQTIYQMLEQQCVKEGITIEPYPNHGLSSSEE
ncbi:MAG: hypothetical protein IJB26_06965 [Clostridia bacterium]|nr:hypothetical protein [Clostridia bacterium]